MDTIKKLEDITNLEVALEEARLEKKYQPELTEELDVHVGDFTEIHFLKIILWKLNRYPQYKDSLIVILNDLNNNYDEEKLKKVLEMLLDIKGIDLPMASTILRFLIPDKCQIIDQRAYRILYGEELKLSTVKEKKVNTYIEYLKKLDEKCIEFNIDFKEADRVLYYMDKKINKSIPLKKYGTKTKLPE